MLNTRSLVAVAVVVTLAVVSFGAWYEVVGAGGAPNPGANVQPGFVGQAKPPTPTAVSKPPQADGVSAAAIAISANTATERMMAHVSPSAQIDQGSAHAELHTFADLPRLRRDGRNYVDDYPIWVVTASGRFLPTFQAPPSFDSNGTPIAPAASDFFNHATYFLDGYSGAEIGLQLDNVSPPE